MLRFRNLAGAMLATAVILAAPAAQAHCDAIDGPVAKAAQGALDRGNVNLALPYAPAAAEAEIREAFEGARKVRGLGGDARTLADRAFLETVVRLHRMGEGAPYTGLKPAGLDFGPVIPTAEQAAAGADAAALKAILHREVDQAVDARLAEVRAARAAPAQAMTAADVAAVRARVSAELGFVVFAEGVLQAAHGAGGHEED